LCCSFLMQCHQHSFLFLSNCIFPFVNAMPPTKLCFVMEVSFLLLFVILQLFFDLILLTKLPCCCHCSQLVFLYKLLLSLVKPMPPTELGDLSPWREKATFFSLPLCYSSLTQCHQQSYLFLANCFIFCWHNAPNGAFFEWLQEMALWDCLCQSQVASFLHHPSPLILWMMNSKWIDSLWCWLCVVDHIQHQS